MDGYQSTKQYISILAMNSKKKVICVTKDMKKKITIFVMCRSLEFFQRHLILHTFLLVMINKLKMLIRFSSAFIDTFHDDKSNQYSHE
jgi:hypothetical protein